MFCFFFSLRTFFGFFFFFQAEDGIRDPLVTGVQTCALPISTHDDDLKIIADAEALPLREDSLDLVVSALALQFVNDLPGTFVQVRRALKPDGLFLAALIGGDSLTELRQAFAAAEAELE